MADLKRLADLHQRLDTACNGVCNGGLWTAASLRKAMGIQGRWFEWVERTWGVKTLQRLVGE